MTHASVFISVKLYADSGLDHISSGLLWYSAGALFLAWAATYGATVAMSKPGHRHLCYETTTMVQFAHATFHDPTATERHKIQIFWYHQCKWAHYKDEVRAWTLANWGRWKEEKPDWFTQDVIEYVPDEYIPVAEVAALAEAGGGKRERRRSSVGLAAFQS
jgi:hypothetical protein